MPLNTSFDKLLERWPHRTSEACRLWNLISPDPNLRGEGIYCFGPRSTGKSELIRDIVKTRSESDGLRYAYIECFEVHSERSMFERIMNLINGFTPKKSNKYSNHASSRSSATLCTNSNCNWSMFERILNQINGFTPKKSNKYSNYASCSKLGDFAHELELQLRNQSHSACIVLDNASELHRLSPLLLAGFLRLERLVRETIHIVLVDRDFWSELHTMTGGCDLIWVHFPQFSERDLRELLSKETSEYTEIKKSHQKQLAKYVVDVFGVYTLDLCELRRCKNEMAREFAELLRKNPQTKVNQLRSLQKELVQRLYHSESPYSAATAATEELGGSDGKEEERSDEKSQSNEECAKPGKREVVESPMPPRARFRGGGAGSHSALSPAAAAAPSAPNGLAPSPSNSSKKRKHKSIEVELSLSSKYLLIAAYLASYLHHSTDKLLFSKSSKKKRCKRVQKDAKAIVIPQRLLGPRTFVLTRLLPIFRAISGDSEETWPIASLYSQISSLVSISFLSNVGGGDTLDTAKFRCNVSREFISTIASNVQFEINNYLSAGEEHAPKATMSTVS